MESTCAAAQTGTSVSDTPIPHSLSYRRLQCRRRHRLAIVSTNSHGSNQRHVPPQQPCECPRSTEVPHLPLRWCEKKPPAPLRRKQPKGDAFPRSTPARRRAPKRSDGHVQTRLVEAPVSPRQPTEELRGTRLPRNMPATQTAPG